MTSQDLERVRSLIEHGHYVDAEMAARPLLKEAEKECGEKSLRVADVLDVLVEALWRGGKANSKKVHRTGPEPIYKEVKKLAGCAVQIRESVLGGDHPGLATSLTNQGMVSLLTGKYGKKYDNRNDNAQKQLEQALRIREKTPGLVEPRDLAWSLNYLAIVHHEKAVLLEGEHERGAEGPDPAETKAGHEAARMERDKAKEYYERARKIREGSPGVGHPDFSWNLNGLALLEHEAERYDKALELYERALALRQQGLRSEHPQVAAILTNLGTVLDDMEKYDAARKHFIQALDIQDRQGDLDSEHPQRLSTLINLGFAEAGRKNRGRAQDLYDQAIVIYDNAVWKGLPVVKKSLRDLKKVIRELRTESALHTAPAAQSTARLEH